MGESGLFTGCVGLDSKTCHRAGGLYSGLGVNPQVGEVKYRVSASHFSTLR